MRYIKIFNVGRIENEMYVLQFCVKNRIKFIPLLPLLVM